jgi:hypothetical protein
MKYKKSAGRNHLNWSYEYEISLEKFKKLDESPLLNGNNNHMSINNYTDAIL